MPVKTHEEIIVGNVYDKYHAKNPIVRWMMRGFFRRLASFVRESGATEILEVGSGEGHLSGKLREIMPEARITAVELSPELVAEAAAAHPDVTFVAGSVYALPFDPGAFDLVVACEVLEHLERPEAALAEIRRVTRRSCVLSVPEEPLWRLLNLARLRYVTDLGNTPGHLQHWSSRRFHDLVAPFFEIREIALQLPWIFVLGEKRPAATEG